MAGSDFASGLLLLIGTLGFVALLFVLLRWIVLWYWRIHEAMDLLKSIDAKLGQIAAGQVPNEHRSGKIS